MKNIEYFFKEYFKNRPLFLSLIRAKEAFLYQKYLPFKSPILDIGCGDGFFAKTVLGQQWSKGIIAVGLDIADSRIEEARGLGMYKKLVIYDGLKMPFANRSFNTVVSNCVLEHIPDLDGTLKEIYRVLKPGGLFITTVMAKPWEENLFGSMILGKWYKDWMRKKQVHLNLFTRQSWDQAFRRAGFRISSTVGYLSPSACKLIDLCHYLSLPSLITYKISGKWVLWPKISEKIYPIDYLVKIINEKVNTDKSGAIFYVLNKKNVKQ